MTAGSPEALPYRHDTAACFAERIGAGGLSAEEFEAVLAETAAPLERLRAARTAGTLPLLAVAARRDDLAAIAAHAERLRSDFARVVVLGTGGASLGGQCLAGLAGGRGAAISFLDSLDGGALAGALDPARLGATAFLAISKSGGTVETVAQAVAAIAALQHADLSPAAHMRVVTEPGARPLRGLAEAHGIAVLDHDPGLGGRYSVLSVTGALPAMIAGLDVAGLRAGAAAALEAALATPDPARSEPCRGAAIHVALARHRAITQSVVMPYAQRLERLGAWTAQLWAESLGKQGHGTTPLAALGPRDQHSLLQLFLDGPADKLLTLIVAQAGDDGPRLDRALAAGVGLDYIGGHTIGDVVGAGARATAETLARRGRPVRRFDLGAIDEGGMGALLMHFMLETIITAGMLGVDPFDQPAVEEGKTLARRALGGRG